MWNYRYIRHIRYNRSFRHIRHPVTVTNMTNITNMTVITNITIITKCTTYTTITVTAKGSPSRGAPAQRVRGGYFSHERHESHPSVTFGDSSPLEGRLRGRSQHGNLRHLRRHRGHDGGRPRFELLQRAGQPPHPDAFCPRHRRAGRGGASSGKADGAAEI